MLVIVCRVIDCINTTLKFRRSMPNTNVRKKFGKRLREIRRTANLSQEELGFKANIHRTYIGAVERGEQNVSLDNIFRLAKALRVEMKELFSF